MTNFKKLEELIKACIYYGADTDGKITKTKLAKLVYLADFVYYYYELKPITGVEYKKREQGPVSDIFFDILLNSNSFNIEKKKMRNGEEAMMCSLKKPFSGSKLIKKEIETIKKVCNKWKSAKTPKIVAFTHAQIPWKISFENDVVPYSLIIQQDESTLF